MSAGEGGFGPLFPGEMDAVALLARQGFGLPREHFDRAVAVFGPEVLRALRANGRTVGSAAVWGMNQWFGGRPVPAQGVAVVAVDPAERGRGHGTTLIRNVLDEARAGGAALSVLYPATLPLYTKAGYGKAGVWLNWSAPPSALVVPVPGDGVITRIDASDAAPLAALRRTVLETANGLPERNEGLWTFALNPDGEPTDVYRLNGPAGPEGYIAVTAPKERRLTVADHCLLSRRAARLALSFLAGYRAQVDRVDWRGGPDDPLALLTVETGLRIDAREEWLLRIVDIEAALTRRGYPAGVDAELTLDVTDPLFPANAGAFTLSVAGGRGVVSRTPPPKSARLSLNVSTLSTLYSGHKGAPLLRQIGLLEGDDKAVAAASRVFAGPSPWMSDRF